MLLWPATSSCKFHDPKFYFTWKQKWLVFAWYLQSIKTFLTLELSQYCKSGSMFYSSEQVKVSSDCCRLGNGLCLWSPVRSAQAVPERGPKSLAIDFCSQKLRFVFWNSLWEWLPDDWQGLKLGLCCLNNGLQRFYLLRNPRIKFNKLCGVWILFNVRGQRWHLQVA